jgi:S1-C subfamily serine protease
VPALSARATDLEAHLAHLAPSIVTLKSLVSWGGDDESTSVSHGAVVDPSGLVLLSGSELGITGTKVRSIHVFLGNDPKEWDAIFVARDSTLDLSYVQILDIGGKALPSIDLTTGSEPRIGQDLFGVSRTGRGFDYAPAIRRLYVTCRIDNPRKMWDFTGEFGEAGLPVFDLLGKPVGVLSNQQSVEGGEEDGGSSSDVFLLPSTP